MKDNKFTECFNNVSLTKKEKDEILDYILNTNTNTYSSHNFSFIRICFVSCFISLFFIPILFPNNKLKNDIYKRDAIKTAQFDKNTYYENSFVFLQKDDILSLYPGDLSSNLLEKSCEFIIKE